jgi:hypothetical protein
MPGEKLIVTCNLISGKKMDVAVAEGYLWVAGPCTARPYDLFE